MPVLNKKEEALRDKKGEIIYEKKFQVATDVWKNLAELKKDRYITGVTPYPRHSTPVVQEWLDRRFKPEYAIMAAVDYGVANLESLKDAGYNIDALDDAEKAKIIYLTHHLGLKNAKRFIKNEITEETAWGLLKAQVGRKSAKARGKDNGGYVKAHRIWLMDYIDRCINLDNYFCPELITHSKFKYIALVNIFDKI